MDLEKRESVTLVSRLKSSYVKVSVVFALLALVILPLGSYVKVAELPSENNFRITLPVPSYWS